MERIYASFEQDQGVKKKKETRPPTPEEKTPLPRDEGPEEAPPRHHPFHFGKDDW